MAGATLEQTRRVLRKLPSDLKQVNEQQLSHLVLVHFPVESELTTEAPREWIDVIEAEAAAQNIRPINFFNDFQSLPHQEIVAMYRKKDGHFTERGNEFAAKILYEKLSHTIRTCSRLSPRTVISEEAGVARAKRRTKTSMPCD